MGIMSLLTIALTVQSFGANGVLFSEDFESLNTGTISGQNGWFVLNTINPNTASVSNNPAVAFQGSQYLSLIGDRPNPAPRVGHFLGNAPIDDVNSNFLFSYSVRFETKNQFGLQTFWNANGGPFEIVHTAFSDTGVIRYFTNNTANLVTTAASINTGEWYNVSFRAFPSTSKVDFRVIRASDNSLVFSDLIPMNTTAGSPTALYDIEFNVDNDTGNHWLIDSVSIVPEPGACCLFGAAGIGLWMIRRKLHN